MACKGLEIVKDNYILSWECWQYWIFNSIDIGFRIPFVRELSQRTHSDVILVAYRGYSDSEGEPTE